MFGLKEKLFSLLEATRKPNSDSASLLGQNKRFEGLSLDRQVFQLD